MEHQTLTLIYEKKICGQLIWKMMHLSPLGDPQSIEHIDDSDKSYKMEPNGTLNHCCFQTYLSENNLMHLTHEVPLYSFILL